MLISHSFLIRQISKGYWCCLSDITLRINLSFEFNFNELTHPLQKTSFAFSFLKNQLYALCIILRIYRGEKVCVMKHRALKYHKLAVQCTLISHNKNKRLNVALLQGWKCPIHNGILEIFIRSIMWKIQIQPFF